MGEEHVQPEIKMRKARKKDYHWPKVKRRSKPLQLDRYEKWMVPAKGQNTKVIGPSKPRWPYELRRFSNVVDALHFATDNMARTNGVPEYRPEESTELPFVVEFDTSPRPVEWTEQLIDGIKRTVIKLNEN